MRQHFFLQNLPGIFDTLFFGYTRPSSSPSYKIQGNILFLNHKSFIKIFQFTTGMLCLCLEINGL
ncbi:hypothetical protein E2C01_018515 [Portunus trituberculatus]|uniref:Uncharacterized protein n=1 Tax=Portunus trituberculatus TaxID=210409 RepID=A0A5B7DVU4_PORTR|nr:hypothetical protein [Portunus trituberculatus]